ncbi:DMT family transporter [Laceyella putida]|uniref:DMT family transporter n=1 Tax=Laceyella putida TaxID=110101 RepID=A0ABW2RHZ5_9BACL
MDMKAFVIPQRAMGYGLVLFAAILWGVSGATAQYLFASARFSPEWLVVIRLLISGILLLTFLTMTHKEVPIWAIWKDRRDRMRLILFGLAGLLGVQYTYFAAIDASNAATATVLQYVAPTLVVLFLAVRGKKWPGIRELVAVALSFVGTLLLVTSGNLDQLSISQAALFWGISSAVALAFYTIQPSSLLSRWGSPLIIGWGMVIGGIGFSFIHAPWDVEGRITAPTLLAVVFIILFGTLIAFTCYLESLKYIRPAETSILASAEPLTAAVLSVIWLHVPFGLVEWIATCCILGTVFILSIEKKRWG